MKKTDLFIIVYLIYMIPFALSHPFFPGPFDAIFFELGIADPYMWGVLGFSIIAGIIWGQELWISHRSNRTVQSESMKNGEKDA